MTESASYSFIFSMTKKHFYHNKRVFLFSSIASLARKLTKEKADVRSKRDRAIASLFPCKKCSPTPMVIIMIFPTHMQECPVMLCEL